MISFMHPSASPPPDDPPESKAVIRARRLLRGAARDPGCPLPCSVARLLELVLELEREARLGYARQLVWLVRSKRAEQGLVGAPPSALDVTLAVLHAGYTYEDADLPADSRLDKALAILKTVDPVDSTTTDLDVINAVGAIHKRKFFVDGHSEHLEMALAWYLRAYELQKDGDGLPLDLGFTWINAAFVLDQLAAKEAEFTARGASTPAAVAARRKQARDIRRHLVERIVRDPEIPRLIRACTPRVQWAYYANLGESYLGLGRYQAARACLGLARKAFEAAGNTIPPGEYEVAVRHLVHIVRMAYPPDTTSDELSRSPAGLALQEFVLGEADTLRGLFRGKVGLALSGGGFRASFFHIGVLAHLAEMGMLRHVEVLSCVSGGSIVGAHYYLKARKLLESSTPPRSDDYVRIVEELHREFLDAVRSNVRARALAEVGTSLSLIFRAYYTRTRRVGELLDQFFFREQGSSRPRALRDLRISVPGESDFNPKTGNWKRRDKVPVLLLNATTLNTGHNWQFAATWMGEPPNETELEIDCNNRLRRLYYRDAPTPELSGLPLGQAVAASACVPMIFEPVALPRLYQELAAPPAPAHTLRLRQKLALGVRRRKPWRRLRRMLAETRAERTRPRITARLVDGGVHDNQGVSSLLEQNCRVLLVSDASGQMSTEPRPSTGPLGVLARSNKILMARVRGAQYQDLRARCRSGVISAFMFLHLRKGIAGEALDWVDCKEPRDFDRHGTLPEPDAPTPYGIRREVQQLLSEIRTDLDSFSETEACALMYSGYRMAQHEWKEHFRDFEAPSPAPAPGQWKFLRLDPLMNGELPADDPGYQRFLRLLGLGRHRMFKVWRDPSIEAVSAAAGLVLLAVAAAVAGLRGLAPGAFSPAAPGARMGLLPGTPAELSALLPGWMVNMAPPLLVLLAALVVTGTVRALVYGERVGQIATGMAHGIGGLLCTPFVRLHLHCFHHFFLRRGTLECVLGQAGLSTPPAAPGHPRTGEAD